MTRSSQYTGKEECTDDEATEQYQPWIVIRMMINSTIYMIVLVHYLGYKGI